MKKLLFFDFALLFFFAEAQLTFDWIEDREMIDSVKYDSSNQLIRVLNKVEYVFYYDSNAQLKLTEQRHIITRANNSEAVTQSNKIYIPISDPSALIELKARSLNPDGSIIDFNQANLKELENSDGTNYLIFAMEGVVEGSEIEYMYKVEKPVNYFRREFLQFSFPVVSSVFSVITPENLQFDFKAYNSSDPVIEVENESPEHEYIMVKNNVPPLREEEFSSYANDRLRIEYKLAYNSYKGKQRLFTWGDAARRIFDMVGPLSKKEEKELSKFFKDAGVSNDLSASEKLILLEHYIKRNISYEEYAGAESKDLTFLRTNKYSNRYGFVKLFFYLSRSLGLNPEIVITSDRNEIPFDKEFDSWNYLNEFLIYFPSLQMYMAPYQSDFRLGRIPQELSESNGLFIVPVSIQESLVGTPDLRFISSDPAKDSFDMLEIEGHFSEDLDKIEVDVIRKFGGHNSYWMKDIMPYLEADRKYEMMSDWISSMSEDAAIDTVIAVKENFNANEWDDPFEVRASFTSKSYFQRAGNDLLVRIGEFIGPQTELYQEVKREGQVVNRYNRGYDRSIKFRIPEGYEIQNPEDIRLNFSVDGDGDSPVYVFKSDYTLNGNIITIQIEEFYDQIFFPVERFEEFRKVINAAADWNKVTLVLRKIN